MFRVMSAVLAMVAAICSVMGCAAHAAGISRLGYSIQIGAFAEVKNAERLTAKLHDKGIDAFYFKKDNNVYAVRFGDFPTREAAQKEAKKLVSEKLVTAYFIAPPLKMPLSPVVEPDHPGKATDKSTRPPESRKPGKTEKEPKQTSDMGAIAARTAERFVGIPYRWGGNTVVDGMDCSGFARAVYNLCGVNIPRTSGEQFRVGKSVGQQELRDGDLVFFGSSDTEINHVGIYVGKRSFVHAPRRGDDIKISSLDENYFTKKFIGARRYF